MPMTGNDASDCDSDYLFINRNDSLYILGKYDEIIDNCLRNSCQSLKFTSSHILLATYAQLKDSIKKDSLLSEVLRLNADFIGQYLLLFFSPSFAVLDFLQVPANKKEIFDQVGRAYLQYESGTEKLKGSVLLSFIMEDEYIRGCANIINVPLRFRVVDSLKAQADSVFRLADSINRWNIFNCYKESRKIFSQEEVGEYVAASQFLIMAHEPDTSRRSYYLELIKAAVKTGQCEKNRVPDFILRTEMIVKGQKEFLRTLSQREEEISKEYGIDDYQFMIF